MTPPAMSTRFESTWLDHKYCVVLNDTPTTRIAGNTSNVSLQLTIARTSQNGTMIPVMGRMRPIIALRSDSGRPDRSEERRVGEECRGRGATSDGDAASAH